MAMILVRTGHDTSWGRQTCHRARQPLLRAVVGYVRSQAGFFPAFGDSNQGCRAFASPISVSAAFLDVVAPISRYLADD